MPKPRPLNIVYIHSHDTGRYVQPYGYPVPTPRFQQLAEEGVLFRHAFCVNPTCSPSRASLLTGCYPHQNGMLGLAHRGARLSDPTQHLASFLRRNGYETALSGVQHEATGDDRRTLGYEHFLDAASPAERHDAHAARRAADFIERSTQERPFFLACGFVATHRTGTRQWHNGDAPIGDPRYVRAPAIFPDTPAMREDYADYIEAAKRLDGYLGIVLDAIDRAGRREDTLVISTTDHGIAFPGMKCNLTDHGIGVLLILRGPEGFAGGRVIDAMVSQIDVYPTLCEMAGLDKPGHLEGRSILPLIDGSAPTIRDEVFATLNFHAAYEPARAIRTTRHKYIRRWNVQSHPILSNVDDSLTKDELIDAGWDGTAQESEQLFDLVFDPTERNNLAGHPAHAEVLSDLRRRLDAWMKQTADPLLDGQVKPGPAFLLNPPDGRSPREPRLPPGQAF